MCLTNRTVCQREERIPRQRQDPKRRNCAPNCGACGLVDILIKALTGTPGAAGKVATILAEEAAQLKENETLRKEYGKLEGWKGENEELKGDKKSLKRRAKMRESRNRAPSSDRIREGSQEV